MTCRRRQQGFSLVELLLGFLALSVLAVMATSAYSAYRSKAQVSQAASGLMVIQTAIGQYYADNGRYPDALSDVSAGMGNMEDPWGNLYGYINHAVVPKGQWRKDKNIVPINSDYDLYSMGPDGKTAGPLTAQASRDDIVRANNGRFLGIASSYDP